MHHYSTESKIHYSYKFYFPDSLQVYQHTKRISLALLLTLSCEKSRNCQG